jgi:hypothetical protein
VAESALNLPTQEHLKQSLELCFSLALSIDVVDDAGIDAVRVENLLEKIAIRHQVSEVGTYLKGVKITVQRLSNENSVRRQNSPDVVLNIF